MLPGEGKSAICCSPPRGARCVPSVLQCVPLGGVECVPIPSVGGIVPSVALGAHSAQNIFPQGSRVSTSI